jgi:hypothetical protein
LDKCNDYGPLNDTKAIESLTKFYKSVGADKFIEKNVFKPIIVKNTQINSEFYLNEVI